MWGELSLMVSVGPVSIFRVETNVQVVSFRENSGYFQALVNRRVSGAPQLSGCPLPGAASAASLLRKVFSMLKDSLPQQN